MGQHVPALGQNKEAIWRKFGRSMSNAWEDFGLSGETARQIARRDKNRDADHIGQTNERRLLPTRGQVRGPLFCAPHFTAIFQVNRCSVLHTSSQRAALDFAPHCVFHTSVLPLPRPSPAQGNPPRWLSSPKVPLPPRKDFGKNEQRH